VTDSTWVTVSAIASAVAALMALITVLITINERSNKESKDESKANTKIYAALIQLDRAFNNTSLMITRENRLTLKYEATVLLRAIVDVGINQSISTLPSEVEKLLILLDNLENDVGWDVDKVTFDLKRHKQVFSTAKHRLEKPAGVKHS
jgi:hypothetical protein